MPRNTTLSRLLDTGAQLTADGALATELEARGCSLDDPLWSAPASIGVHRDQSQRRVAYPPRQ